MPSTERARRELGVEEWTRLEDAVQRTIDWYKERPSVTRVAELIFARLAEAGLSTRSW